MTPWVICQVICIRVFEGIALLMVRLTLSLSKCEFMACILHGEACSLPFYICLIIWSSQLGFFSIFVCNMFHPTYCTLICQRVVHFFHYVLIGREINISSFLFFVFFIFFIFYFMSRDLIPLIPMLTSIISYFYLLCPWVVSWFSTWASNPLPAYTS